MFVVKVTTTQDFWLRGTVWAFSRDRATEHPTEDAAKAALNKARPFMKLSTYKAAKIEPA